MTFISILQDQMQQQQAAGENVKVETWMCSSLQLLPCCSSFNALRADLLRPAVPCVGYRAEALPLHCLCVLKHRCEAPQHLKKDAVSAMFV